MRNPETCRRSGPANAGDQAQPCDYSRKSHCGIIRRKNCDQNWHVAARVAAHNSAILPGTSCPWWFNGREEISVVVLASSREAKKTFEQAAAFHNFLLKVPLQPFYLPISPFRSPPFGGLVFCR